MMTTQKAQHTAGEWSVELGRYATNSDVWGFGIRVDGKKPFVCSAGMYQHHSLVVQKEYAACDPDHEYFTTEEVVANAHLLAAAPKLLAALEKLLYETDNGTNICGENIVEQARAAIASARPS